MFMRWVNNAVGRTSACWAWRIMLDGAGRRSIAGNEGGSLTNKDDIVHKYKPERRNVI